MTVENPICNACKSHKINLDGLFWCPSCHSTYLICDYAYKIRIKLENLECYIKSRHQGIIDSINLYNEKKLCGKESTASQLNHQK